MKISLCARSKILQLLEPGKAFRIQSTGSAEAGAHVDLLPNVDVTPNDVTISTIPLVVVDLLTATLLADRSVDFDYETQDFIISNRGHENGN